MFLFAILFLLGLFIFVAALLTMGVLVLVRSSRGTHHGAGGRMPDGTDDGMSLLLSADSNDGGFTASTSDAGAHHHSHHTHHTHHHNHYHHDAGGTHHHSGLGGHHGGFNSGGHHGGFGGGGHTGRFDGGSHNGEHH